MAGIFSWIFGGLKNRKGDKDDDYISPGHEETKGQAVLEEEEIEDSEELYECDDCGEEFTDPDDLDDEGLCSDCRTEDDDDEDDDKM